MNSAQTNRRLGVSLLIAAAAALALLLATMLPGFAKVTAAPSAPSESTPAVDESCAVAPYAFASDKEVAGAFGPAITARGEAKVKAELHERRTCGKNGTFDPYLTAAHYSEWSHYNLTSIKLEDTSKGINDFAARLINDTDLYGQVVDELEALEGESTYSEASVRKGIWSLYMVPDGANGVTIKVGRTQSDGTNAVFTHGDIQIRYRLDCGFQPNREGGYPGIEVCTGAECTPPQECKPGETGTWPDCKVKPRPKPTPSPKPTPKCPDSWGPDCLKPKAWSKTPKNDGWTPRNLDNEETDGKQSERQKESGETRGNAVDDQVPSDTTNNSVTPDTKPSKDEGPVAEGGNSGGDDQSKGEVDPGNTNQDEGGTTGDTCVPDPIAGITC